ncbi:hypothetical protein COHA_003132 [Chlorella ohadii]|uniref:Uncharacterized protein n=1 Tax=Chlorella ohadii TaxID=2649997 RepID=A0AAD5DW12_9CHLO|nr:hypothetical protein COHA_003132 [Chlorella ohadii]
MGHPVGRLLAGLLLMCTLAHCQAWSYVPFRPTEGSCHVVSLTLLHGENTFNEAAAKTEGAYGCQLLGPGPSDWQYVRSEVFQKNSKYWTHYCRRCGLQNTVLLWFGTSPLCDGSCPTRWQQLTQQIQPFRLNDSNEVRIDVREVEFQTMEGFIIKDYTNSEDFGSSCGSGGKVLCALPGRPESAGCSYTWRGTAPICLDACEIGETLVAKDHYGGGKLCSSGYGNKMLCERCQTEIHNLNDCTAPTWFGTAPVCQGECNTGDRIMYRAVATLNVPVDQDPAGFGKLCFSGYKYRCQLCSLRNVLGSGGGRPQNGTTCSAPKPAHIWTGTPSVVFTECYDMPACRRFHVGPTGCALFGSNHKGALKAVPALSGRGRAGGSTWQAGSKQP